MLQKNDRKMVLTTTFFPHNVSYQLNNVFLFRKKLFSWIIFTLFREKKMQMLLNSLRQGDVKLERSFKKLLLSIFYYRLFISSLIYIGSNYHLNFYFY
jgi:hypothetical protein